MLFVLIHRIIFHDKNLMDEEILKTASNAAIKAMTVCIIKVDVNICIFLLYNLKIKNKKNVFLFYE